MKTIKRLQPRPVPREAAEAEGEVEERDCTVLYCTVLYCTGPGGGGGRRAAESRQGEADVLPGGGLLR